MKIWIPNNRAWSHHGLGLWGGVRTLETRRTKIMSYQHWGGKRQPVINPELHTVKTSFRSEGEFQIFWKHWSIFGQNTVYHHRTCFGQLLLHNKKNFKKPQNTSPVYVRGAALLFSAVLAERSRSAGWLEVPLPVPLSLPGLTDMALMVRADG